MTLPNTIFDWILSASLRASLLIPVVLAAQWLLRKHLPANWRYALWLPVLIALLVPTLPILPSSITQWWSSPEAPVATLAEQTPRASPSTGAFASDVPEAASTTEPIVSAERLSPADEAASGFAVPAPAPIVSVDSPAVSPTNPPTPIDWRAIALWAWLVGAAAAGFLILASFVMTMRRVKRAALPVDPDLLARIAHLARAAGLRRAPRVRRSSAVSSPAVCGLWRPALLINERFEADLSEDEMELILRHELAHIRRGDLLLNALQCVLLALHWFNSLLWLAFFRARVDREAACDDAVLRGESAPRRAAYGHTLLKMETGIAPSGLCLGFVGILQGRGSLRTRIQSIIARRKLNGITATAVASGIAMSAVLGITGVGAESEVRETYPPTDVDFVKSEPGEGTAKRGTAEVWGIGFAVPNLVGTGAQSSSDGSLGSDPEKTDARREIKLGEDVTIRLEKVPGSPISFQINGRAHGALEVGDEVIINKERKVTVNGRPRAAEEQRNIGVWKEWQRDIAQFEAELREFAETAKVPEEEPLKKRLESRTGDLEVITDGYGGVVDFNAAKGTVQYEANKKFGGPGGPHIDWEFELLKDTKVYWNKSTTLIPKIAPTAKDGKEDSGQPIFSINIAKTSAGPFRAGDRVRLKASIDDFSRFRKDYGRATGLVAIYYLEDSPNPVFSLRLDEAEVTLVKGANQDEGKNEPSQPEETSKGTAEEAHRDEGLRELQGGWKGIQATIGREEKGEWRQKNYAPSLRMQVEGDVLTVTMAGEEVDGATEHRIKVDNTKNPKTIDFFDREGELDARGIYEIKDNVLKMCLSRERAGGPLGDKPGGPVGKRPEVLEPQGEPATANHAIYMYLRDPIEPDPENDAGPDVPEEAGETQAADDVAEDAVVDKVLLGSWRHISQNGEAPTMDNEATFRANGTGVVAFEQESGENSFEMDFKYTADGNRVTLAFQTGEQERGTYAIDAEVLTVRAADKDTVDKYERVE